MEIYLFNPENDLALGLGCANYTAPPHAADIHRAGALLPVWWAEDGDFVVIPEEFRAKGDDLSRQLGLNINFIPDKAGRNVLNDTDAIPSPWGWSLDARRQFLRAGVSHKLPTDTDIEAIRALSHRRSSIRLIEDLRKSTGMSFPVPVETTDACKVVELEHSHPGCFIKSPWSGSGRGVFCAASLSAEALFRRAEGIIHRQGSVIVEKGLDKVMDFAALFHADDSRRVTFRGFSIFETEERGMYSGNIAAPQTILKKRISELTDLESLMQIIAKLEVILSGLIDRAYSGWLGIDMMIYKEAGELRLMPCVELNLRMTMGVAAMKICQRLGLDGEHFLSWRHCAVTSIRDLPPASRLLLPPERGFSLILTPR